MNTNTNRNTDTTEILEQAKLDKAFRFQRDERYFHKHTLKGFAYKALEIYIAHYRVPRCGEYYSVEIFHNDDKIYAFWEANLETKVISYAKKWVDEIKEGDTYAEEEEDSYVGKIKSYLVRQDGAFRYVSAVYDDHAKIIEGTQFTLKTRKSAVHRTKDALYQLTVHPKTEVKTVGFFARISGFFNTLVHAHL